MAENVSLIGKYSMDEGRAAAVHMNILSYKPAWESFPATQRSASALNRITAKSSALEKRGVLQEVTVLQALIDALSLQEEKVLQWILTVFYDMLREDSSTFSVFEDALGRQLRFFDPLVSLLKRSQVDQYVADKAAWLLTAVIGNVPRAFGGDQVKSVVQVLQGNSSCSELGVLDGIVNLLKADAFRKTTWQTVGVSDRVLGISPQSAPPAILYKSVFAVWMLSFEPEGAISFDEHLVTQKIRDVLAYSRVEKVVRLSLTVLKNFLGHRQFMVEVVELGLLETVQQLEYEKWRDSELYDDIRDMSSQIATKVQEMSSFDRYERELMEQRLKWGFIHSAKFWTENVLKFEQNDFKALKLLATLLHSEDITTLAVACHDLGDFVAMHPLGKKQISKLGVKERVMELMGSTDPDYREVRREALLCCQKIMLNKWQEVA